jgi:hypothetical protein
VLDELERLSRETRSKLLDWQLLRRRRQKAGTQSSRSWYVNAGDWVTGTVAADEAPPAFLDYDQVRPRGRSRGAGSGLECTCLHKG